MQNHSDSSRERYRAPGRPMEMDGAAIPRFTPLTPREDWYWRLNPTVPQKEVTHSLLVPISLKGTESVGGLFHYTVRAKTDLRAPWTLDTALDLDAIVGTEITVFIDIPGRGTFIPGMPGDTGRGNIGFHVREITGRVSTARFIERNDRTMVYEFVLEPTLKQASMGQNYRVFQNKTVIDAIRELLADYPVSIDWRVAGPIHGGHYPVRDLQRQHFETDFTCFRRWCERAGLFFWFEHSEGFHRLIIADTMGAFHRHGEAYETLRYAPGENRVDEECIEWLELDSHWTEGKVTVVDHDPMAPRLRRSNTPLRETDHDPRETAEADQEFYEYGVNVSQPLQGAMGLNGRPLDNDEQARQAAMVRMQSIRCQGVRIRGSGHLRGLRPGYTFELTEHPLATVNQEWLVLSMKLDIECNDQASGTEQAFRCDCEFEAQPAKGCHFRLPIVTPWPVIGAERAIVTGPEGSELWTDAQGRVCVQLVADRQGKYDNDSFIWLWPAQPWQNGRASSVFLPRIGSEVVVEHINGNPDMPYVAGGLGNRDNPPPWELAKNMWLTGIRTRESGGSGSNHLVFDDTHGKQQVQLATDFAMSSISLGNHHRVAGDEGRQDARGIGVELRTDAFMALRAALGGMFTTFARLLAKGKIKENGEAVALLTAARDIHENAAQLAQQRGAQEPGRDQSDAVTAIKTANDELRGSANPRAGADDFPEFERPHLLLASAAGIQAAATDDLHLSSGRHLAASATGHVSLAAGKSLLVSVLEKIAFYAQETIRLISTGPVHAESRNGTMTLMSQDDMTVTSTQGRVDINAPKGINLRCNNTLVSLRPDGFYVYTNGQHLIHAAGHATADAQGQPVQFPVTPDSPGKYALHPVLVEHGGGFAIPNQPYRMTLDDGQVITGTTTEHGELSVVTSNAVVFGTVELLSQSEPDHVIGITNVTVSRDAAAPVPAQISDLQPRKAVVGGKTISTPSEVDTTQSKPPAFLACDPMNFGLRTSRYATKPRTTIVPREPGYSTTVEYPVAKTYALAVKEKFNAIDWKGLAGKSLVDIQGVIVPAMQGALWGALQTGPFGLPKGNAMPSIEIVDIISAKKYNMLTDVTASFMSKQWVMGIYESYINEIIGYALNDDKAYFEAWKGGLASALYHEARHCQQIFWMVSLFNTYPDDYSKYSKIGKYFSDTVNINIFSLASETRFPNDDRVRVGMHALLMFYYYWQITEMRNKPGYTYVNEDFENVEKAVCTIRGVTPEIARKMAPHDSGYYAHLHEEDAYATGEPVSSYWTNANTLFMREPGLCTEKYSTYLAKVGVKGNV